MSVELPVLSGFGISGFRGIRERMVLGPLSKTNVLGGVNNSGKTTFLLAIEKFLGPMLQHDGLLSLPRQISVSGLDVPQVPEGDPEPEFEIGIALQLAEIDPVSSFMRATSGLDAPGAVDESVGRTLRHAVFAGQPTADPEENVVWFWFDKAGQLSEWQRDILRDDATAQVAMSAITRHAYGGEVSWNGIVQNVVRSSRGPTSVVAIPAIRQITPSGHRESTLPSNSGAGLSGMLLSLIAPRAVEYRQARVRLQSINALVSEILGRQAELLVPHDADTVHVAMKDLVLPLANLGAGIEQVVLLATICTQYEKALILMEEPDLYLHPTMQRQLLHQLRRSTDNTYVVTTHSAAMLDSSDSNIFRIGVSPNGTTCSRVSAPRERASLAATLGFRASDLVQANSVIWVEGPSDRIYIKRWLYIQDPRLIEGIHFSFIMYGGRLAEHYGVEVESGPIDKDLLGRFLDVTRINRNSIFVMDSDQTRAGEMLAGYKTRISESFEDGDFGFAWVTKGTMIENYSEPEVFQAAYASVHPRAKASSYSGGLNENPFVGGVKRPDKVAIAVRAAGLSTEIPDRGDLRKRMKELAKVIVAVNDLAS